MLTVAKVTGQVAAGYADYLQGKTTASELGDYYLRDGERVEAAGRWVTGARHVSSDRRQVVSGGVLRSLLAVRHPVTGEPLRRIGGDGTAVAAIDATFSAPKSVSAVWALADSGLRVQIEAVHERAVDQAVAYACDQIRMVRERVGASVTHQHAVDMVATGWRHTTARAVPGRAPDPQLHTHVLLHAGVRRDAGLAAIDSRAWLLGRREVGAAYRTELAHGLARLGFEIERGTGRGGRYFEIAGVPTGLIDRWSGRHHQVRQAIENRLAQKEIELNAQITQGGPDANTARQRLETLKRSQTISAAEDRLAGVSTRSTKTRATVKDLDREWISTARHAGFDRRDLRRHQAVGGHESSPVSVARLVPALTELQATFTSREARAIALEQSAGASIDDALGVLADARRANQLLALSDARHTTAPQRAAEQHTLAAAEQIALDPAGPIARQIVDAEIDRLSAGLARDGAALSDEQRDAVRIACGEDRLVVIDGQAGTGKSTVLQAIARAHKNAGQQILVTSTAALAASRLARELTDAGVDCTDYSTVGLIRAAENDTVTVWPQTTVIHDEAALASTAELGPLTELVRTGGGRLVLVGDPHQSHPVGAGGLWPRLEEIAEQADARAELTRNVRARDPADRRDQALFRCGEHEAALRSYQDRGRLHTAFDAADAEDAALDAAQIDRQAGRSTIVITQTSNDHLDELNARAQALRLAQGELGTHSLALAGRPYRLRAGDEIQIRRTITHPDHGPLRNGTPATIITIDSADKTAEIMLDDGRQLRVHQSQLDRAQARLSYVQHPFPAQGITVDTAHVLIGAHVTRQGSYVGLTRARHHTDLYHTPEGPDAIGDRGALATLADRIGRDEPDLPSIAFSLADPPTISHHAGQTRTRAAREPDRRSSRAIDRPPRAVLFQARDEVAPEAERDDSGWEW